MAVACRAALAAATLLRLLLSGGHAAAEVREGSCDGPAAASGCGSAGATAVAPGSDHLLLQIGRSTGADASERIVRRAAGSCCDACVGSAFCSPVSQNCYPWKRKHYYESCSRETTTTTTTLCSGSDCPIGWYPTAVTSGTGRWCEVGRAPENWLPLKTCPTGTPGTLPTKVKVLTYNLYWWNLFERRGGEGGRAGRKIAHTVESVEYDFMGFQECKDVGRVMRDAARHGLEGDYGTLSLVREDRALGMAFLRSRWRLVDSGTEDVGEDRHWQYYGKRAIQWARFQAMNGSTTVFLVNHHGPLPVSAGQHCAGSSVAYNIMRVIAQHAHPEDALLLVGDFNAQSHSSRIQTLDRFMHRVYSGRAMGGVDHVYSNCAGDTISETRNLGTGGSDHHALSVTFSLPTREAAVTGSPPALEQKIQ